MENNQPTKIVSKLYKRFETLRQTSPANYYEEIEKINKELRNITTITGAIEVMSKDSIIKLCAMESSLRFMALHTFLIYISKAK